MPRKGFFRRGILRKIAEKTAEVIKAPFTRRKEKAAKKTTPPPTPSKPAIPWPVGSTPAERAGDYWEKLHKYGKANVPHPKAEDAEFWRTFDEWETP